MASDVWDFNLLPSGPHSALRYWLFVCTVHEAADLWSTQSLELLASKSTQNYMMLAYGLHIIWGFVPLTSKCFKMLD